MIEKTLGDKIRAMENGELADWLYKFAKKLLISSKEQFPTKTQIQEQLDTVVEVRNAPLFDKMWKITRINPCEVGDIVLTSRGWDCGMVMEVKLGMPRKVMQPDGAYYGGPDLLDWYASGESMSIAEWMNMSMNDYYAFREKLVENLISKSAANG